jgi:hypothetical protein
VSFPEKLKLQEVSDKKEEWQEECISPKEKDRHTEAFLH